MGNVQCSPNCCSNVQNQEKENELNIEQSKLKLINNPTQSTQDYQQQDDGGSSQQRKKVPVHKTMQPRKSILKSKIKFRPEDGKGVDQSTTIKNNDLMADKNNYKSDNNIDGETILDTSEIKKTVNTKRNSFRQVVHQTEEISFQEISTKAETSATLNDQFQQEKQNQLLTINSFNNQIDYDGQLDEKGNRHGNGKLKHKDGDHFEGNFQDGKADGYGQYYFQDGTIYQGFFQKDQKNGNGKEIFQDGTIYSGNFLFDQLHGNGEMTFSDGSKYVGRFGDNQISGGNGEYTDQNKIVYNGKWRYNKLGGKSRIQWPDQRVFIGEFRDNQQHGKGVFIFPDGKQICGIWEKDKIKGVGIIRTKTKTTKYAVWNEQGNFEQFVDLDEIQQMQKEQFVRQLIELLDLE